MVDDVVDDVVEVVVVVVVVDVVVVVVACVVVAVTSILSQSSVPKYPKQHSSPDLNHPTQSAGGSSVPIPLFVQVIATSLEICHSPQRPVLCVTSTSEVVVVAATVVVISTG